MMMTQRGQRVLLLLLAVVVVAGPVW